jgi:hypothetical protein
MSIVSMPRGSILQIQAYDLSLNGGSGTLKYNKVTEHNRSAFDISTERIEKSTRMANGLLRKFFIADKKTFSLSWEMLPSYRTLTVDGAWGAEDLRSFYNSTEGQSSFNIRVNLAKNGSNQESSGYEEYTVVFGDCNFSVLKRGLQPFWSVSLTLVEV